MSFQHFYQSGRLSQYVLWLACLAGIAGLLCSRALVALSPVAGVVAVAANPNIREGMRHYARNGAALRAAALYVLLLVSAFYTVDWVDWRHETYRVLPWLVVPLAFTAAVPLNGKQRLTVGCFFIIATALLGGATLGQYLLDPAAANAAFGLGQSLPAVTGVTHIPFSVMLILAMWGAWHLALHPRMKKAARLGLAFVVVLIVVVVHVLAYRTGLLVLYLTLAIETLRLVFRRRIWLGLSLAGALVVVPWLAFTFLPPVRERVGITFYDVIQYRQGHDINELSLARRLAAWQSALVVAQSSPWLGVGPADVKDALMRQYEWHDYGVRPENRIMIHNQYLHYLVGGGILGLSLWLLLLVWPLAQPATRRNPYIRSFLLVMAGAMLVDSLLQVQISFNLFVFGYSFLVVAAERRLTAPLRLSA